VILLRIKKILWIFLTRAEKFGSEEGLGDIFNGHPKIREWPDPADLFNPSQVILSRVK
jgi:hypothetical protein